jgi:hypothetical protein
MKMRIAAGPGRPKGSPNKRTVQKMIEASQQVAQIKKLKQKKATEVLNDLIQTAMGMVALYQRKVMTEAGLIPDAKAEDIAMFKDFMLCAGTFAKALAPFQDPTFKAITVTAAALPGPPGEDAKLVEGKVIEIDDPQAAARVYARMMKQVR